MHNDDKITHVVYEEGVNSEHMEKYSVVMHYLARIERSGDTKYIFLGHTQTKLMSVRFVRSSCARSTD